MTTVEDKAEFINVERASNWRIGTNTKLRAWSSRFLDSDGDWNEGIYSNKLFRTAYFLKSQMTVAGVERKVNKICRLAWSPVAVTNSDKLVPAIKPELTRRADRIHALRIVNNEVPASRAEWRSAFNRLRPDTFIHVLTVSRSHSGDIGVRTEVSEIAISFTRDPYSDQIYTATRSTLKRCGGRTEHSTTPDITISTLRDVCLLTDGPWGGSSTPAWAPTCGAATKTPTV